MAQRQLPERFRSVSDADWFKHLAASITQSAIDGLEFPGFPPAALQKRLCGQSGVAALHSAYSLYEFAKSQMQGLGNPIGRDSRVLDFGCGWGRFLRFFWKDVGDGNLYGCDTNATVVDLCDSLGVPGSLAVIEPLGRLPYPSAFFDGVMASSVFTHLSEEVHLHASRELARVCKPLAVVCMTVQPRRFLDDVAAIPVGTTNEREIMLRGIKPPIPAHVAEYAARGFTLLAANQERPDVPAEAVCSPGFITRHWGSTFDLKTYIDHASQMPQAAVVLQRRAHVA